MIYVDIPPKQKYLIIQEMTRRDNNLLSITVLCDIAGVSRSGYYRWCAEGNRSIIPRYRKAVVPGTHTAENHDFISSDQGSRSSISKSLLCSARSGNMLSR